MENTQDNLCVICQMNSVGLNAEICDSCKTALENKEAWALDMLEMHKHETKNLPKRDGYFKADDPTQSKLDSRLNKSNSDMNDVLDQLSGAIGVKFSSGFLDLVEQYNPAVERIEEILKATKTALTRESMIIQFYEITIDYLKHTPEEFDKHGDGYLFAEWAQKAEKADFVWRSYNRGLQRQGKTTMSLATFKRRLAYARQRLRDYEKNR